jgi:hypothetical protein
MFIPVFFGNVLKRIVYEGIADLVVWYASDDEHHHRGVLHLLAGKSTTRLPAGDSVLRRFSNLDEHVSHGHYHIVDCCS